MRPTCCDFIRAAAQLPGAGGRWGRSSTASGARVLRSAEALQCHPVASDAIAPCPALKYDSPPLPPLPVSYWKTSRFHRGCPRGAPACLVLTQLHPNNLPVTARGQRVGMDITEQGPGPAGGPASLSHGGFSWRSVSACPGTRRLFLPQAGPWGVEAKSSFAAGGPNLANTPGGLPPSYCCPHCSDHSAASTQPLLTSRVWRPLAPATP